MMMNMCEYSEEEVDSDDDSDDADTFDKAPKKKRNDKKRKVEQKAAAGPVSSDGAFVRHLAEMVAARKTEQVLGTDKNQEAFDAWTQEACERVATVLDMHQDNVSAMAMLKALFETGKPPPNANSEAYATFVEALETRHRNFSALCEKHGDVEVVASLDSVLAYAAPSSNVLNVKTWTPTDADPQQHLQTKGGGKPPEFQHTKWASEEAVNLPPGELMPILDSCSVMQIGAASREEPRKVLLEEAAELTALVLKAAASVFSMILADGAINNKLLKQAISASVRLSELGLLLLS